MQSLVRAILSACLLMVAGAAHALVCGQDLNGDGYTDAQTETASCQTTAQGEYCPVGSAACVVNTTCPLDPTLACTNGSCSKTGSCTLVQGAGTVAVTPVTSPYAGGELGIQAITASGNQIQFTSLRWDAALSQYVQENRSVTLPTGMTATGGYTNPGTPTVRDAVRLVGNGTTIDIYTVDSVAGSVTLAGQIALTGGSASGWTGHDLRPCAQVCSFFGVNYVYEPFSPVGVEAASAGAIGVPVYILVGNTSPAILGTLSFSASGYQCDATGQLYANQTDCANACVQTASCTSSTPTCPVDPTLACMEVTTGNFRCSPNPCVDLTTNPPQETTVASPLPDDSGPRDANGNCLGQVSFFGGRAMTCGKVGVDTGWTDCCDQGQGGFYADSVGATVQSQLLRTGLTATAQFASLAVTNFTWRVASGQAASGAASAAANYALNHSSFLTLNPANLYLTAATLIVQYLLTPQCDTMDMETAALKNSKMCHYVGKYCSKEWAFIGCVQRRESHCCFNSMLGRIIHEQGRPQLSTFNGWGTPENPDCRGFTPEEFQSLDFSSMDLSEYFGFIQNQAQQAINSGQTQADLNNAVQQFYNAIR